MNNFINRKNQEIKFKKQVEKYGFDERETYAVDNTMIFLLKERLIALLELSSHIIDWSYPVIAVNKCSYETIKVGENLTKEIEDRYSDDEYYFSTPEKEIKRLIKLCRVYERKSDEFINIEESRLYQDEIWLRYLGILEFLWW